MGARKALGARGAPCPCGSNPGQAQEPWGTAGLTFPSCAVASASAPASSWPAHLSDTHAPSCGVAPPCPPRANAWHRPPLGAWPCCSASLSIPQPHTLRSAPCSAGIPQPGQASALTILSASPARPRLGPGDASARGCHDTAQWLQFRGWKSDQGVLGQLLPRPCGRICPPPCPGVAGDARVPPLRCLPSSSQALPLGTAAPRVHLI